MKTKLLTPVLILLCCLTQITFAQSYKSLYKTGRDFFEAAQYDSAVVALTASLALKADYGKTIEMRAKAYESLKKYTEAATDFKQLTVLDAKEEQWYLDAGRNLFANSQMDEAVVYLEKATNLESKLAEAYVLKFKAYFRLGKYNEAQTAIDAVILLKPEDPTLAFPKAIICDSLHEYEAAKINYEKTIAANYETKDAYLSYIQMLVRTQKLNNAKEVADRAINAFTDEKEFLFLRADIYRLKLDYPNAINDLSRVTLLDNNNIRAFLTRAVVYKEFNQFQSSISDYGKVISLDPENYNAYFHRGACFQEVSDTKSAERDYAVLEAAAAKITRPEDQKLLGMATTRLFELRREADAPTLLLDTPSLDGGVASVSNAATTLDVAGTFQDKSPLLSATLNGTVLALKQGKFNVSIPLESGTTLHFEATDIYQNVAKIDYPIKRTEANPPTLRLLSPFASENGEIYLEADASTLYVEGIAQDESNIRQISINGVNASFSPSTENPKFTANIPIKNTGTLALIITDIYGNTAKVNYNINRDAAMMMSTNPMGKTWVLFIDNSNYETFASLEGPTKDIVLMKNAVANYQIHNSIHKKDMTKRQMERFFSIELRDLIRSNRVNSLIVWYAGHGKFINETGYWIPVDAKRDDEFTYFNINNLKAAMQSYSNDITHTLVITDACESGPSFYQAMRSLGGKRTCDDPQATKFRSSQVFSSAGYELASDNSQFTKAFAKALEVNESSCLSIDEVVQSVTSAVKGNNQQSPQFGKIAGLEDQNGTFFFMKK
ncbi:MAG: hypothetical protein RIS47_770 [Bacteroidota bacterium]